MTGNFAKKIYFARKLIKDICQSAVFVKKQVEQIRKLQVKVWQLVS